jgi:hypothetical protein
MRFRKHHIPLLFVFIVLLPSPLFAELKSWTGYGGDTNWSNALNWSGGTLPLTTDDVLLDNSDLPVSYTVVLPDIAVVLKTMVINPSSGRNIELQLPSTNKITNAFTVTGPGYGIELKAGAIFRNASGLSAGESLVIADSIMIHDGGRYIHQTRASHANSILKFLSTAPGTEQGVFDFNVPKASYTISVSNRTYGSLELHADALGANVNYTCTGANPLLVHGNLRIGASVNMSMDLSGVNGNIQVEGDFIQEGGQLKLASGTGNNTILRIKGDLYQTPGAIITETANGIPFLELNGQRRQEVAMAGQMQNQVGFRMNNLAGATLKLPLELPYKLELIQGVIFSSASALLILDASCGILVDSSKLNGAYIGGPIRKLGLDHDNHFIFPVGKDGNLRWLELKGASGNYTVEYIRENPASIGNIIGSGLAHISGLEYWTVFADGPIDNQAKIELSFASVQSGGVTDPAYLNVAKYQTSKWNDAGHTAITGNFQQGSVLSGNSDFSSSYYTLASVLDLENPLPLTTIDLRIKEISGLPVFSWVLETDEKPEYFKLCEESADHETLLARIPAVNHEMNYNWESETEMKSGNHYFRVYMIDTNGNEYNGKLVNYKKEGKSTQLSWCPDKDNAANHILIQSETSDTWSYEIISLDGRSIKTGSLQITAGFTHFPVGSFVMASGLYVFRASDSGNKKYVMLFCKI